MHGSRLYMTDLQEREPDWFPPGLRRDLLGQVAYRTLSDVLGCKLYAHEGRRVVVVCREKADGQLEGLHEVPCMEDDGVTARWVDLRYVCDVLYAQRLPADTKTRWLRIHEAQRKAEAMRRRQQRAHDDVLLHETSKDLQRSLQRSGMGKHHRLSAVVDGFKGEVK